MTPEREAAYRQGLDDALNAGFAVLEKGGSAPEAVLAATISLEDNILFNAGKGSVFASERKPGNGRLRYGWKNIDGGVSLRCKKCPQPG